MRRTPNQDPNQRLGINASDASRERSFVPIAIPGPSGLSANRCTRCPELSCCCNPQPNVPNDFYVQGNYLAYRSPTLPSSVASNSNRSSMWVTDNPAAAQRLAYRPPQNIRQMRPEHPIRQLPNQNQRQNGAFVNGASIPRYIEQEPRRASLESLEKLFRAIAQMAVRGAQETHMLREILILNRSRQNLYVGGFIGQMDSVDGPHPSAPEVLSPRYISMIRRNQLNYDFMRLGIDQRNTSPYSSSRQVGPVVPHLRYADAARIRRERINARRQEQRQSPSYAAPETSREI